MCTVCVTPWRSAHACVEQMSLLDVYCDEQDASVLTFNYMSFCDLIYVIYIYGYVIIVVPSLHCTSAGTGAGAVPVYHFGTGMRMRYRYHFALLW